MVERFSNKIYIICLLRSHKLFVLIRDPNSIFEVAEPKFHIEATAMYLLKDLVWIEMVRFLRIP